MFDLVFYKNIKFYCNLKEEVLKEKNETLKKRSYNDLFNNDKTLIYDILLNSGIHNNEFQKNILNYCNDYIYYFN